MRIKRLRLSEILYRDSLFNYQPYLFKEAPPGGFCLKGQVLPLVVYTDPEGKYHLVDGFRRYRAMKEEPQVEVDAVVLENDTALAEILFLRLCQDWAWISSTGANRLGFVAFAWGVLKDKNKVAKELCKILKLRPSEETLEIAMKFMKLPFELREFFHKKSYSAKQLESLLFYPAELLTTLGRWLPALQLTASLFEELIEGLYDHIRAEGLQIKELEGLPEIKEALRGENPHENTRRLRELIKVWRNPILTEKNKRIEAIIRKTRLPEEVRLSWDRSLENHQVNLNVAFRADDDVRRLAEFLSGPAFSESIKAILKEL